MSQLQATPLYTDFDNEGCMFLGTVPGMGHLFDVYISNSVVDGLDEILAVPADHHQRGPIAMESTLCKNYKEGHPLHTGYQLAKAKGVL